ncbi:TPA: hypothetical protein ACWXEP_005174 [Klebsiella pneumoniae]|uniref:hypothetical protein n=1 Tax=Klebsiella pneumoniae complex TaxID=3390273 RepID=UPI002072C259|nr:MULTISPECIES: hypothetical protein [Klebsiella]EIY5051738.1 hypothetical protein [Klebsiella quasipneumoniae]EKU7932962.1 hypothetical protein [Klebsiella pneumoniae]EKW9954379.1 hypothetical protein [Klebsiella pneumoniae]ELP0879812.1 hypothetical protein [Klebsiella pneumoniae]MCM6499971.1 hypothetical protein [Klebsiella pneumoniae]
MKYFNNDYKGYNGILQGDVFRINNNSDSPFQLDEQFAVLITADCDLANPSKNVNYLTFLPIISSTCYLENIWIPIYIEKIRTEVARSLHKLINELEVHKKHGCDELKESTLREWLRNSSYTQILSDLSITDLTKDVEKNIKIDEISRCEETIDSFIKIKKLNGSNSKNIARDLREAITKPKEEFFVLPMIDSLFDECGILKLRMIRPVHRNNVYTQEIDARLSNQSDFTSLVRIGRLSDYLRYSISQNFASLFSRIGMPENYESDREESINLFFEKMEGKYGK